ncbi:sigma-70 family RNA polymerase sigma factor [Tsuneonella sp. CC-YZS046]|uniref:sigma-70 family RNA polymerase sigma factor n=1 Tax=Tsuneonella sp. CC-YZS046 TaxID=3042152 RepID=UPI002D7796DB|nr:sigma-70 family RNA polymerase sigma factor [Tsuneonella sp. CC-YZS046]WRO65866.1 sigma-70 family RNA polymerase sigma factor [Tsuneonella sp. CC-YZS046]
MLHMVVGKWFGNRTVEHVPAMRRYACTLVGDEQADDLVHEALTRAYASHRSFRQDGNLGSWLLAIVHNCFVSGWRKRQVEGAGIEHLRHHAPVHMPPGQEHAVQLGELARAIEQLPLDQRSAFHLVVVEDLSYEMAASILHVPVGTIMSRLSRARAALRRAIEGRPPSLRVVEGKNG